MPPPQSYLKYFVEKLKLRSYLYVLQYTCKKKTLKHWINKDNNNNKRKLGNKQQSIIQLNAYCEGAIYSWMTIKSLNDM